METTKRNRVAKSNLTAAAAAKAAARAAEAVTAHELEIAKAPSRPQLRPAADSKTRAALRAAELRQNGVDAPDGEDRYYIPPTDVPDGWTYEWKRRTVYNQEDPAYQVRVAQGGWEAVPADRHPHMMPLGYQGHTIERDGMVLMERPQEISEEARERDLRRARQQVNQKREQVSGASPGEFDRTLAKIKSNYERIEITDE